MIPASSAPVVHGRKLSHVPDKLDARDHLAAPRLRAAPPPPRAASCRDLVRAILDQFKAGSCTANTVAYNVMAAMLLALPADAPAPPFLSRRFAYWVARAYDHATGLDDGAQIRNVIAGILEYGFCPEEAWPYSDDFFQITKTPSWGAFRAAIDRRMGGSYERIDSTGAARVDDVKRAIAARHLVSFGTAVSDDFCSNNFDPNRPLAPPREGNIAGLHALTLAEYDGDDTFRGPNSWGPGWGAGGWWTMSPEYLTDLRTTDLWVIRLAPKFDQEVA